MVNTKIHEKALKIESCAKFVTEANKSLPPDQENTNKQNLNGVCLSNFIKIVFFFQSINFVKQKHGLKWFRDLFEIKHTELFKFLHIFLANASQFQKLASAFLWLRFH